MAAASPVPARVLDLFSITHSCVVCAAVAACASVLKTFISKKFEPGTKPRALGALCAINKLKTIKKLR